MGNGLINDPEEGIQLRPRKSDRESGGGLVI